MSGSNFSQFSQFFIKGACKWLLLIAFVLCGLLSVASAQNRFVHVPSYPAGGSLPTLLAQHDVNGDGKLDLIVMNINSTTRLETVSLLLGTGTGGYLAPKTMASFPVSYGKPLLADVNRDGRLDLIFSLANPQQTRVYLSQGEAFQTTALVSKGGACPSGSVCNTSDIQVADLNKDGNPDLLISFAGSLLYVSLGNGNGSFRAPIAVNTFGDSPGAYTIGDFNSDSLLDIAIAGDNGLQILLGNGDGTFRRGASQGLGIGGGQLLSADLRGNGKTDLILVTAFTAAQIPTGDCRGGGVAVFLGNGDGTFAVNGSFYRVGQYSYGALIADMNGDHRPDIVVANQLGASYSVLLNAGLGKFSAAMNYRAPEPMDGNFVVGDLNGDGRPDLTISSQTGVEVLRNTGGGRLLAPVSLDLQEGAEPSLTYASDLNHDGIPDLALISGFSSDSPLPCRDPYDFSDGLVLLSQNGQPFSSQSTFGTLSYKLSFGLGDFNRDGNTDIAADLADRTGPPVFDVEFNNGKGQFINHGPFIAPSDNFGGYPSLAVGDFNRDGFADVVLSGNPLLIGLGDGKGGFNLKSYPAIGSSPSSLPVVRDLNGDGKLDLVMLDSSGDAVEVLLGNGDGTFQTAKKYATMPAPNFVTIADFNRDGKLDLAVGGGSEISLLLNNGNGTFKTAVNYPAGGPVSAIANISLMGNGNQSMLVADGKDNKLLLLTGDGKGTFAAPVNYYPGGGNPQGLTVADFNLDGAPDVAVTDWATSSYMILYNTGGTYLQLTTSNAKPKAGQAVTITATVTAGIAGIGTPSGTVAIKDGLTTLGTVTLSGGKVTFSTAALRRGTHTITASYYGSSSFNPHLSTGLTEMVQ